MRIPRNVNLRVKPAEKGDVRNLTNSSYSAERDAGGTDLS